MVIKLYMVYGSPPVNAVLMVAKALNLELELHEMDFTKQEYLADWFVKLNPSHTVPTIDDNGFVVWDSHAILYYLAETYGKNGYLLPKENLKARTLVHQILNLDCGTIFRRFSDCMRPVFYDGVKTLKTKPVENLKEAYSMLERIIGENKFFTGTEVTIADISLLSTLSLCNVILPITTEEFPKLKSWMTHLESLDFYKASERGVETFKSGCKIMLSK